MKKILLVFLILICLLTGGGYWFSKSFNAESYREKIIANISQLTGRKVEIKGGISLTWTPFPTISISDLEIANQEGSLDPVMFSVKQVRAEIEWISLLKNPLVVKKVVLSKPVIVFERIEPEQTNFNFPVLFKTVQNKDPAFLEREDDFSLVFNEIEVDDGRFVYNNAISAKKVIFDKVSGIGIISSLNGPFTFSGNFLVAGKAFDVDLRFGEIELSQKLPVTLNLTDPFSSTDINGGGYIELEDSNEQEWLRLTGLLTSKDADLFLKNVGINGWPKGPVIGSFTLNAKAGGVEFEQITIRQGEGDSETSLSFTLKQNEKIPTFLVKDIDYPKWKPLLDSFIKTPLFASISTDFFVSVEKAKVDSDNIIRGNAQGKIENGSVIFSDLVVQVDQNSSIGLNGIWYPKEQKVDADIQFQSSNFSNLIEKFWRKKLEFPYKDLKNAQLLGHIIAQPRVFFSDWKSGILDGKQFSGKIDISFEEKLATNASLMIKNLNLDTYGKFDAHTLENLVLPKGKYIFDLNIQNLIFHGNEFSQVNLAGKLAENNLDIKELYLKKENELLVKMIGNIQNLGTNKISFKGLEVNFEILNSTIFNTVFDGVLWKKVKQIKGNMAYTGSFLEGDFAIDTLLNENKLKAKGKVKDPLDHLQFLKTDIVVNIPEVQKFLALFDERGNEKFPNLKGELNAAFNFNGWLSNFSAKDLKCDFLEQSITGEIALNMEDKTVQADLTSPKFVFETIFPKFEEVKNKNFEMNVSPEWQFDSKLQFEKAFYSKAEFDNLNINISLKDQILTFSEFDFSIPNEIGKMGGNGKIILKNPIIAEAKFYLENMAIKNIFTLDSFTISEGSLAAEGDFIVSGNSWEDFKRTIRGQGNLFLEKGMFSGLDMNAFSSLIENELKQGKLEDDLDSEIKKTMSSGKTPIISAEGSFQVGQGEFLFTNIKFMTTWGEILIKELTRAFSKDKINAMMSIGLKAVPNIPLDVQVQNNQVDLQLEGFKKLLAQQIASRAEQEELSEDDESFQDVQKLYSLAKEQLEEIIQIHDKKPELTVLAGLVERSEEEKEKITENLRKLSDISDKESEKKLIMDIQESFEKIQKALKFAQSLISPDEEKFQDLPNVKEN